MKHRGNDEQTETHNTSRFFVEHHGIAWVLMLLTLLWGVYGYLSMPQRKDPKTPVREALIVAQWQGATTDQVERLLTKRIEDVVAQNGMVTEISSTSRPGLSVVNITLDENHVKDTDKEFNDIGIKLSQIGGLPQGAGPVQYVKDFGNTAALMLTVASPPVSDIELSLRASRLAPAIRAARKQDSSTVSLVFCYPHGLEATNLEDAVQLLSADLVRRNLLISFRVVRAEDAILLDGVSTRSDAEILQAQRAFSRSQVGSDELHPDIWPAVLIRDPNDLEQAFRAASPQKYTYRQLDVYTDRIMHSLQQVEEATRIDRAGVVPQLIHLNYNPARLAAMHLNPLSLADLFRSRNTIASAGEMQSGSTVNLKVNGSFHTFADIAALPLPMQTSGSPLLLRDALSIDRGYEEPPSYLNFYNYRDSAGRWHRGRAITITAELRAGRQIATFSRAVDTNLDEVRKLLPSDLILERTSDQPRQVRENVHLFTTSLWEAIGLVVFVSLVGFWDWRSAALMATSIPITLAMTAGMMAALGIDLQQVSIASLIIALGLLVDDPVVAGDAIKRELGEGQTSAIAAWLGPTKLARAILFATVTNILAYLPFLLLHGDTGHFIYSLPVVITCSLVASRIVSMTFVPLLGQFLLRQNGIAEPVNREHKGFMQLYYTTGQWSIDHRKSVLTGALVLLLGGGLLVSKLDSSFFPYDLQYLSYADIWLPEGVSFADTAATARQVEQLIEEVSAASVHDNKRAKPRSPVLKSITTFVGGGGPRFWDSVAPQTPQVNYAEVLMETFDKHDTNALVPRLQEEISRRVPGARVDVRQLETGPPIAAPVSIRILGPDPTILQNLSSRLETILRAVPSASRVRNDWGHDRTEIAIKVDPARATLAGLSVLDVTHSSAMATAGLPVSTFLEDDQLMPILLRQQLIGRASLSDIRSQSVFSNLDGHSVPLGQVAEVQVMAERGVIRHYNLARAITVSCFPTEGALASNVMNAAKPQINQFERHLPAGYSLIYAGEYKEQNSGFADLTIALSVSVLAIYLALMFQFKNAVKPLIVFAAIPFGCVGAFLALYLMQQPFGFMAFLGVASLIGVIVSHIIVLFDYIEEQHEKGEQLFDALLDAGMLRLRPVLITVGATAFALVPLAAHGGPLWEPLCYAQIGGLIFSTLVTLLLVPTLYAFMVLDLRWVHWEVKTELALIEASPTRKTSPNAD